MLIISFTLEKLRNTSSIKYDKHYKQIDVWRTIQQNTYNMILSINHLCTWLGQVINQQLLFYLYLKCYLYDRIIRLLNLLPDIQVNFLIFSLMGNC